MTERYERVFIYGPPSVDAYVEDTWTDQVKALMERLEHYDYSAVAHLLEWDIEFLCNQKVIAAIIILKYSPDLDDKSCRAELRRIANVIGRRPKRRRSKLPYGDRLEAELKNLTAVIQKGKLLEVKGNAQAILKRLEIILRNPMLDTPEGRTGAQIDGLRAEEILKVIDIPRTSQEESDFPNRMHIREDRRREIATLAFNLHEVMENAEARTRTPRSWALKAMAAHYDVEPKEIEQAISREIKAGRRRR